MPAQFIIFRTQVILSTYLLRRFVYCGTTCCYIRLLANMVSLIRAIKPTNKRSKFSTGRSHPILASLS